MCVCVCVVSKSDNTNQIEKSQKNQQLKQKQNEWDLYMLADGWSKREESVQGLKGRRCDGDGWDGIDDDKGMSLCIVSNGRAPLPVRSCGVVGRVKCEDEPKRA